MTFCAHCGNGLPQLAAFCDRCGAPVTPPTTAPVEGGLTAGVDLAGLSPQEQVRLAGDPRTPPQLLRDLAALCPGVRMLIATNPATYPDLLTWLAGLGDPALTAAASSRLQAPPSTAFDQQAQGALASQPLPPTQRPQRSRDIRVAAGAAAVVVLIGAAAFAVPRIMDALGAGPQPSTVVPTNAVSYLSVDLNPSVGQKAAAVQFLAKFPSVRSQGVTAQSDLRRVAFDALRGASHSRLTNFDFDKDVKPWLGTRFAMAVVPGADGKAIPSLILDVTDAAKASASLSTMAASGNAECQVTDRFAVCAERGHLADVVVTDPALSLDANQTFRDDVASVNGDAVATAWSDVAALAKLPGMSQGVPATSPLLSGRTVAKMRFDGGSAVEVVGQYRGPSTFDTGVPAGTQIGKLPADTVAALSSNGLGKSLLARWPEVQKSLPNGSLNGAGFYGLSLPDDLAGLLGDHATLGLGGGGSLFAPRVALVTDGDQSVADKLVSKLGGTLFRASQSGQVVLSTSRDYGVSPASTLEDQPAFKAAVPAAAQADAVLFLDVPKLITWAGTSARQLVPSGDLDSIAALGMSSTKTSFVLRLTTT